ncbi:Kiwa anti-phage protein KwaB-like domain-containing protein, partial [Streptococcus equi]
FIIDDNKVSIKKLETDNSTVISINGILSVDTEKYKANSVNFDGSYKPDEDESLKIENFDLPDEIKEAINNPLGVEKLIATDNDLNIRAVFLTLDDGEEGRIVFQRTQKRQLLLGGRITLFWNKDTFISTKKPGVVITDSIDAYYENGTLYFKSYYLANQILNLNKYYRQATDEDIRTFCQSSCFYVNDLDSLVSASNNWTRKKIAYILDTKVLETNSIDFILQDAKELGLQFQTNGENKIVFPEDLKAQKELLSYLADEIYKGRLTDDVYLTNSKRTLK